MKKVLSILIDKFQAFLIPDGKFEVWIASEHFHPYHRCFLLKATENPSWAFLVGDPVGNLGIGSFPKEYRSWSIRLFPNSIEQFASDHPQMLS